MSTAPSAEKRPKKSILKKSNAKSQYQQCQLPKEENGKATALYLWQNLVDRACQQLQLSCVANASVSSKYLGWTSKLLQKRHYEEIVAERNAQGLCGYPCCANAVTSSDDMAHQIDSGKYARYRIDSTNLKVYDNLLMLHWRFCSNDCRYRLELFQSSQLQVPDQVPTYSRTDAALQVMQIVFHELNKENLEKLKLYMDKLFGKIRKDADGGGGAVSLNVVEKKFSRRDKGEFSSSVYERAVRLDRNQASKIVDGYGTTDTAEAESKEDAAPALDPQELPALRGTDGTIVYYSNFHITPPNSDDERDDHDDATISSRRHRATGIVSGEPTADDDKQQKRDTQMAQEAKSMLQFNVDFMVKFLQQPLEEKLNKFGNREADEDSLYVPEPEFKPSQDKTIRMPKFGEYWTCLSDWCTKSTCSFFRKLSTSNATVYATPAPSNTAASASASAGAPPESFTPEELSRMRVYQSLYQSLPRGQAADIFSSPANGVHARQDTSYAQAGSTGRRLPKRRAATEHQASLLATKSIPQAYTQQPNPSSSVSIQTKQAGVEAADDEQAPTVKTEEELSRLRVVYQHVGKGLVSVCRQIHHPNIVYLNSLVNYLLFTFNYERVLPPFSVDDWKVVAGVIVHVLSQLDPFVANNLYPARLADMLQQLGISKSYQSLLSDLLINGT